MKRPVDQSSEPSERRARTTTTEFGSGRSRSGRGSREQFLDRFVKSEFARHGFLVFASSMFVNFSSYAFNFVLSRSLGVSSYGSLASVVAGLVLGSIPAAILGTVIVKHSAELNAVGDERRLDALAKAALRGAAIYCSTAVVLTTAARGPIAGYLHLADERTIVVAGAILGISFVVTAVRGILQGTQNFRAFAISTLVEGGLRGALGICGAESGLGVFGALLGWLAAEIIALGVTAWCSPQVRRLRVPSGHVVLDSRRIFQSTRGVAVSALAMTSLGFADVILVKHFFSSHAAGVYSGLSLCGRVFTFGLSFLPTIMLPKATARAMRGEPAFPVLAAACAISAGLAFAVISAIALEPRIALELLVGKAYTSAAPLVMPYCIAVTFLTLTSLVVTYKTAMHRFDFVVPIALVSIGEILAIYAHHQTIAEVVTVLVWGNLVALVSSCWRVWNQGGRQRETSLRTVERGG